MKQMCILKTLNGISDDLIEEASPDNTDTKAKNPIWKPCLAAACAIAVLTAGGVLGYYKFDRSGEYNIMTDEATTVVTPGNTGKYSLGGGVNDGTGKKEHITVMTTEATRQQKPLYDIYLSSSENEIKAADGKKSVRFTAEVPADASEVFLIGSEDGSRTEMLDNADYAGSGDDITGDGVFSCMLDIDLSEPAEYTFRAECTSGSSTLRSNEITVTVYKGFDKSEVSDIKEVNRAVSELLKSDGFKALSREEKVSKACELLNELADNGTENAPHSLVRKDSITVSGSNDVITYRHANGVIAVIDLSEKSDLIS